MMDPQLLIALLAGNAIAAIALTLTPVWARPGNWFGVRVPPDYRSTPQARESRKRFTIQIWIATLGAALVSFAAVETGRIWLESLGVVIQIGAAMVAFRAGWRQTRPHAIAPPTTRSAHLLAPHPHLPGGVIAVTGPFLLLALACGFVLANWNAIPARFPVHWDGQGHANGWGNRSISGVFGPVFIALIVLVILAIVTAFQARNARRAPVDSAVYRRNRAMLAVPILVMWIISMAFSLVVLTPLILVNGEFPIPPIVMLLFAIAGIGAALWMVVRASAEPNDAPPDNTPDECWKWGQFYYNPNDSAILVERRFGVGYTLNFARWQAWLFMSVVLALVGVVLTLAFK